MTESNTHVHVDVPLTVDSAKVWICCLLSAKRPCGCCGCVLLMLKFWMIRIFPVLWDSIFEVALNSGSQRWPSSGTDTVFLLRNHWGCRPQSPFPKDGLSHPHVMPTPGGTCCRGGGGRQRVAGGQGKEQHSHTERGSHTRRDEGECSRQGGGGQRGRGGSQDSGNREPEKRGWESMRMGSSDNTEDGLASQPHRYRVPGQPLLNRHQVGGVSCSPDGLFAYRRGSPPGADQP